jgi:hypothetical protein
VPQDIVPVFGLLLMDMPIVLLLLQQYLKQLLFDSALKYQRMMFTKSFSTYKNRANQELALINMTTIQK